MNFLSLAIIPASNEASRKQNSLARDAVSPVPLEVEQTQLDTGFSVSKLVAEVAKPSKIGVFSKTVTLRICRILWRLRLSASCFLTIATGT